MTLTSPNLPSKQVPTVDRCIIVKFQLLVASLFSHIFIPNFISIFAFCVALLDLSWQTGFLEQIQLPAFSKKEKKTKPDRQLCSTVDQRVKEEEETSFMILA